MSSQAVAPDAVLNLPAAHGEQAPSFAYEPKKFAVEEESLEKPSPAGHAGKVMAMHLSSLDEDAALYSPGEQRLQ